MKNIAKILSILTIFLIFSCQNNGDLKNINNSKIANLLQSQKEFDKKQVLGQNQISSKFWTDEDGNSVKEYSISRKKQDYTSYLPIISYFMPKNYENYQVIVTFDKKGNMIKIDDFYNIVKMKPSLFCNPPAFSCIERIN